MRSMPTIWRPAHGHANALFRRGGVRLGLTLVRLGARAVSNALRKKRPHWPSTSAATPATCTSTPTARPLGHLRPRAPPPHPAEAVPDRVPHGLAARGRLTFFVLGTLSSPPAGLAYLGLFSFGSTAGMSLLSGLVSLPMAYTVQGAPFAGQIRMVAGGINLILGLSLAGEIAVGGGSLGEGLGCSRSS